jgi:Leucine-rich repeat (LRR) protein
LNEHGRVTHLSIFNVRLKGVFPDEIFLLNDLEYLDIRENGLTAVPAEINKLKKLRYLDIRYNELAELPGSFNELTSLERLYLGYNSFETVPDNLDGLENLFLIDFTENRVADGVEKLFVLPRLTNIYLNQNRLKSFPFGEVPRGKIRELNVSENMIVEIPGSAYEKIEKIIF